jgi:outer membrane protein assembly factor BamA
MCNRWWSVWCIISWLATAAVGQKYVLIDSLTIEGLHHTRINVVLKELDFKQGDSLSLQELAHIFERNEQRLESTGLFNDADLNIKKWEDVDKMNIHLKLRESWYIYPAPIFELADRNFNVWAKEMNYALDRTNYGVRIDHLNATGRKDKLKAKIQSGYTRKYELTYNLPYLKNKWGFGFNWFYAQNKEIGYKSINNKIAFKKYEDERILLNRLRIGFSASNRANAYTTHSLSMNYYYNTVDASVTKELNPNFFPNGDNFLEYIRLEYILKGVHTIYPLYPSGGYAYAIEFKKHGLGFGNYSNASIEAEYEHHFKVSENFIIGTKTKVKTNLTNNKVPYQLNQAIGYGNDVLRGYELYVVDGSAFALGKTSLRYKIADANIDLKKKMPFKAFKTLPVRIFAKAILEGGYAYEPSYKATNLLSNKGLLGYGPGLDFIFYNAFLLSLEYNLNIEGDRDFYVKSSFNF